MCIYNFTDLTKFNKIIHKHSKEINQHSVIGCLIRSESLRHVLPLNKLYSFIVINKDHIDLDMQILMSANRLTHAIVHDMLDCFDEYLHNMTNQFPFDDHS